MQRIMFDMKDEVKVIYDKFEGKDSVFIGIEGIIEDISVNDYNDTIYGLRIKGLKHLLYFLALELELA